MNTICAAFGISFVLWFNAHWCVLLSLQALQRASVMAARALGPTRSALGRAPAEKPIAIREKTVACRPAAAVNGGMAVRHVTAGQNANGRGMARHAWTDHAGVEPLAVYCLVVALPHPCLFFSAADKPLMVDGQ